MSTETLTIGQVTDLLNTVIAGIRIGDSTEDRVYSLREVHERTGWALSQLEEDCRNDRIEHTRRGRSIGLTSHQLAKLINDGKRGGQAPVANTEAAEDDELDQVRSASKRAAGRKRPRRAGADA